MNNSTKKQICRCSKNTHTAKFVVLTGGPGAGKTAVLEMASRMFCHHVLILPEAAGIVFGGGFIRKTSIAGRKGAQRAIFHVQREQERIVQEENSAALVLCDRGSLDSLAYWPNSEKTFFSDLATDLKSEQQRYSAIIHLRTPSMLHGYNQNNPLRIEDAPEAAEIDEKITRVWDGHPRISVVESNKDFFHKAAAAIKLIEAELPGCCKRHFDN